VLLLRHSSAVHYHLFALGMFQTCLTVCAKCSADFQVAAGRTPPGRRCYIVKLEWPLLNHALHQHFGMQIANAVTRGLGDLNQHHVAEVRILVEGLA
jgi:hypothetical protein